MKISMYKAVPEIKNLSCQGCYFYNEAAAICDEPDDARGAFFEVCQDSRVIWIRLEESNLTKLAKTAVDVFMNSIYSDKLDKEKLISMVAAKFESMK